jgi:RNA polymerase sigma factor (sigma-70 family)
LTVTIGGMKPKLAHAKVEIDETGKRGGHLSTEFDSIFQEYWERICRILVHLVGDRDEAEDLALETFWRLYHRPPAKMKNLGGWLYRVATNLGYNAVRARQRRLKYERNSANESQAGALHGNPADEAEKAEERTLVRRTLARMKNRSARLLVLHNAGLSYAEIAEILQVSTGSIGTLLARAEREFEKIYFEEGGTDAYP